MLFVNCSISSTLIRFHRNKLFKVRVNVRKNIANYSDTAFSPADVLESHSQPSLVLVDQLRLVARKIKQNENQKTFVKPPEPLKPIKTIRSGKKYDHKRSSESNNLYYLTKHDPTCEVEITKMVKDKKYDQILERLKWFSDLERHPTRDLLRILAGVFATKGNEDGIHHIQAIAKKIYPKEYSYLMKYEHYLADAYWKNGKYEESLNLFLKLHRNAHHFELRRKVNNFVSFFMAHVFSNKLQDQYEPLLNFAQFGAKNGDYSVALDMWRWAFESTDVKAHELADELMEGHLPSQRIIQKCCSVIKTALNRLDVDMLQRLIVTVRKHNISELYTSVFGTLLYLQCQADDLRGTKSTLKYCLDMKIPLPSTSIQMVLALLSRHQEPVPQYLLNFKYKIKNIPLHKFEW